MAKQKLFVSTKDESPRLFKQDWMDFFSRVHFTVPLFIFIPAISYLFYRAFFVFQISILEYFLFAGIGIICWSFVEYSMHRFVFHYHAKTEFGKKMMFIFHGVHHDYPNDSLRLVLPPAVSIPLASFFYFLFSMILPSPGATAAFCTTFYLGYLTYDMLHYAFHHAHWTNKWFLKMKKHHMDHHFIEPDLGYGVSNKLWDVIFRTEFKK